MLFPLYLALDTTLGLGSHPMSTPGTQNFPLNVIEGNIRTNFHRLTHYEAGLLQARLTERWEPQLSVKTGVTARPPLLDPQLLELFSGSHSHSRSSAWLSTTVHYGPSLMATGRWRPTRPGHQCSLRQPKEHSLNHLIYIYIYIYTHTHICAPWGLRDQIHYIFKCIIKFPVV